MLPLYDYQKKVVDQMIAGKTLNCSRIGSGKTIMSLGCLEKLQARDAMLISPKSLVLQWQEEAKKFWPELTVIPVLGDRKRRAEAYRAYNRATYPRMLAISYDLARQDIERLAKATFDVITFDEIHKLKEPRTKTRSAFKFLKAHYRFGLSGSPLVNHYGNLYCIMQMLKPDEFPNYWRFINTHAVLNRWRGVTYFRDEDNLRRMFAEHMTMAEFDPAQYMPPMSEIDVPIRLSDKEKKVYDTARKVMLLEFEREDISKLSNPISMENTLVRLVRLQEIANSLELLGDHTDSTKIETIKEMLADQIAPDEQAIIFTKFARFAEILHRELGGEIITGQTQDRATVVKRFKAGAKLLIGTNAIQEGLNLTEANVVIMADQSFTSAAMSQKIGRAWRLGQTRPVRVYHLLAEDTVDYKFKKLVDKKRTASDILLKELI